MNARQKILPDIKRSNMICYILYAGILIGFAAFIVYPDFREIKQLESDIKSVKKKNAEQQMLYTQYHLYMAEIEKLDKINYFNFTVSIGSEKCNLLEINNEIKDICKSYGFRFRAGASYMTDTGDRVLLSFSITGNFQKLRDVLIDFGKISCLELIEQIRIFPAGNIPDTEMSGPLSEKEIMLTLRLFRPQS
ncbi:MAG: hypothetical protein AB7S75_09845 [Desulfococcaceae bacterium]